jgi:hypothetical protein
VNHEASDDIASAPVASGRTDAVATRTPATTSDLTAVFWLAMFSFRELVRRRRLISLCLIMSLPVLVVVILRLVYSGEVLTPRLLLSTLGYHVFVPFLVPVTALAVGVSAISEQINEGTLVFPWVRPVRRGAIFVGYVLAAQLVASTLLVLSLVGCFLAMTVGRLDALTLDLVRLYLSTCAVLVLGAFAYTALFALAGSLLGRPMLACILFAFVWEGMIADIPQRIQEFGLRFHLRNLIERPPEPTGGDIGGVLEAVLEAVLKRTPVPDWRSLVILLAVIILATLIGMRALGRRQITT